MTCRISGRVLHHPFVIADISFNVLLGLDFMAKYKLDGVGGSIISPMIAP